MSSQSNSGENSNTPKAPSKEQLDEEHKERKRLRKKGIELSQNRKLVAVLNNTHLLVLFPHTMPDDIAISYSEIKTCWFSENPLDSQPQAVRDLENPYTCGNIGLLEGSITVETNTQYKRFWFESTRSGFLSLVQKMDIPKGKQLWIDNNFAHYNTPEYNPEPDADLANQYMYDKRYDG